MDEETVKACIERINKFMHDFKIKAHVERYLSGPVVTQYDLGLEPGVKSSTIRGVQMDLTRNLLVKSVRLLDVVPGTPYVGLELPNPKRQLITLGEGRGRGVHRVRSCQDASLAHRRYHRFR